MTQPQQPFGHVSEEYPRIGRIVYGPQPNPSSALPQTQAIPMPEPEPRWLPKLSLLPEFAALAARVADLERRLAEMTREDRA